MRAGGSRTGKESAPAPGRGRLSDHGIPKNIENPAAPTKSVLNFCWGFRLWPARLRRKPRSRRRPRRRRRKRSSRI